MSAASSDKIMILKRNSTQTTSYYSADSEALVDRSTVLTLSRSIETVHEDEGPSEARQQIVAMSRSYPEVVCFVRHSVGREDPQQSPSSEDLLRYPRITIPDDASSNNNSGSSSLVGIRRSRSEKKKFAERYQTVRATVRINPYARFAVDTQCDNEPVVLEFYDSSDAIFNASLRLHRSLDAGRRTDRSGFFVCRLLDFLKETESMPPCMVFERGEYALEACLEDNDLSLDEKRDILRSVLEAIRYLHSQNIVRVDLKPAKIAWFPKDNRWKLLHLKGAVRLDDDVPLIYSLAYVAPEIAQAIDQGRNLQRILPSVDMWSFGAVAYEVLTGQRMHGVNATPKFIWDVLCGVEQLPKLDSVLDAKARDLLSNLLLMDPNERMTAAGALGHPFFRPEILTDVTVAHSREASSFQSGPPNSVVSQLRQEINEVKEITRQASAQAAALAINVRTKVERFCPKSTASTPFHRREVRQAITMNDSYLPERHPVSIIRAGEEWRLCICLESNSNLQLPHMEITSVQAKLPQSDVITLATVAFPTDDDSFKAVSHISPPDLGSDELCHASYCCGSIDRRYVRIELKIHVIIRTHDARNGHKFRLNHAVYIKVVRLRTTLLYHKMRTMLQTAWQSLPEEAREGITITSQVVDIASCVI